MNNEKLTLDQLSEVAGGVKKMRELKKRAKSGKLEQRAANAGQHEGLHIAANELAEKQGVSNKNLALGLPIDPNV